VEATTKAAVFLYVLWIEVVHSLFGPVVSFQFVSLEVMVGGVVSIGLLPLTSDLSRPNERCVNVTLMCDCSK
jgi:hypothetical protein